MEFHTSGMTLFHHPLQRIPIGFWSHPLLARQIAAPRFQIALVESVTLGAHLKKYRIYAISLQDIELRGQHLLHFVPSHAIELVVHALYPCTSKFTFRGILRTSWAERTDSRHNQSKGCGVHERVEETISFGMWHNALFIFITPQS
jgi:hypothetical protein